MLVWLVVVVIGVVGLVCVVYVDVVVDGVSQRVLGLILSDSIPNRERSVKNGSLC